MQIILYSDEYGLEAFDYETEIEARIAYEELKASVVAREVDRDRVERTILLVIDSVTITPEGE